MARSVQTTFRPASSTGAFTRMNAALALCAAELAGTPDRPAQVRRLGATADANLLRSGRTREMDENARQITRDLSRTEQFEISRRKRKKAEMRFAQ